MLLESEDCYDKKKKDFIHYPGELSASSKPSSVLRKSKASRACSIETLMLEEQELDREFFWKKKKKRSFTISYRIKPVIVVFHHYIISHNISIQSYKFLLSKLKLSLCINTINKDDKNI